MSEAARPVVSTVDYYSATVPGVHPMGLVELVTDQLGGRQERRNQGQRGYRHRFDVLDDDRPMATVLCGGNNDHPHVYASGQDAPALVGILREHLADHQVTRIDSALDFDEVGIWDKLAPLLLGIADRRGLKVKHEGDFHRARDGRTLYVGSPKSPKRVRQYEKGIKSIGEGIEGASPHHVRSELQFRPSGDGRKWAARATSDDVWGTSPWTRGLFTMMVGTAIPRVELTARKDISLERALEVMADQWGARWLELAEREGGDCNAGVFFGKLLRDRLDGLN